MQVLFRDEALIVVDKPAGLIVHRGMANDKDCVADRVRDLVGHRVHAGHRLDRGTTGVLVFALTTEAAQSLQTQFAEGSTGKTYLALTRGLPKPKSGVLDYPIPKGEGLERVPAVSTYRSLGWCLQRYAWVEVTPQTGRFHQVRRHLRHLSCPLIGDANYGSSEHNRFWRETFGLARLALHASRLSLNHPLTGQRLTLEAPLADDLTQALKAANYEALDQEAPWPAVEKPTRLPNQP
jgi:tRNA pseudouridine65 synthase